MCGIWGAYSSNLSAGEISSVKVLGLLSQLRGTDSTGVIIGHNDKGSKTKLIKLRKAVGNSSNFFESTEFKEAAEPNTTFLLLVIQGKLPLVKLT